jgi:hypothetical protein
MAATDALTALRSRGGACGGLASGFIVPEPTHERQRRIAAGSPTQPGSRALCALSSDPQLAVDDDQALVDSMDVRREHHEIVCLLGHCPQRYQQRQP